MNVKSLSWYWNRLWAMNGAEILFRLTLSIKKKIWKLVKPNYKPIIKYEVLTQLSPIVGKEFPIQLNEQKKHLLEEAECYLNHKWLFFGLDETEEVINWHQDPQTKTRAPIQFGFDINHRDENLVGNIKNIWEKNRHHHLTILAIAFYLTKDEKYAKEVQLQLKSWIDQNPYLMGVNWTHPLEQGIRLISWVYISFFLRNSQYFDSLFGKNGVLWNSIYEHQKFIIETYSRGSSANNHLIGEMAGLYISSFYWPVFNESKSWNSRAKQILEEQLINQNYSDGVNKEQAFSYQIFVLEFGILSILTDSANFLLATKEMICKMSDVAYKLREIVGYLPNYGDGDEGRAIQILPLQEDRLDWLLSLTNQFMEKSYSVDPNLADYLFESYELETSVESEEQLFLSVDAGLFAKKWSVGTNQFSTLVDFGALGMGSLAAHGHSDALSFVLSINNRPIIVDTGTYCYHDNLEFREYFRGTKGHNTVIIDGRDQSQQIGPFLWGSRANVKLLELDSEAGIISASHDGYNMQGVTHTRRFQMKNKGLNILDTIEGTGNKHLEIRFHLHPSLEIEIDEPGICSILPDVSIRFPDILEASILKGESVGGWYSPNFGTKEESCTLVLSQTLSLPVNLEIEIN